MRLPWFWGFAVLVCREAGASGEESGPVRLNGIWGESVTFSPVIPSGSRVDNIVWNAKSTIAIVKPGKEDAPQVIDQRYRERLRVLDGGYSLQIMDLSQEDTSTYTAQIATEGITEPIFQRFALHVYKRYDLTHFISLKPRDRHRTTDRVRYQHRPRAGLRAHCEWDVYHHPELLPPGGGEDLTYTWTQTAESSVVSSGASILISHRLGSGVSPVTCTARNPISNSSKSISPQEVCEEADAETNTVYAKVGNSPLACSRMGTQKRGPETKEDETKTIYSKVHHPNQSPPQTDDEKLCKEGLESMEKGEKTIYATVNQPNTANGTKTAKSTDADDSAATPKPQATTEYDKII
ncbi:unnamed protein product [Lepidochelys olivacea]